MMKKTTGILMLLMLALAGFAWRIYLNRLVPQVLVFDQQQYVEYANTMLLYGWAANTVRLYGYPLLLLPLISVWGTTTQWPWLIAQSLADISTALLVWAIVRKLFPRNGGASWMAYIIYLANPYTSAYTGVALTEITAIWIIAAVFYLLVKYECKQKLGALLLAIFLLGYMPHVRPSFFYFSVVLLFIYSLRIIREKAGSLKRLSKILTILVIFFIPFIYTVVTNLKFYHEFNLLSVDNVFWRELYISNYIGRGIPFKGIPEWDWPKEAYWAWFDFHTATTPEGRQAKNIQYRNMTVNIFRENPRKFIINHFYKLFYVWEKHFLFTYKIGPDSPLIRFSVYWVNILLLFSGLAGLIGGWWKSMKENNRQLKNMILLSVLLFAYISIAHIFSTSEERFSLPAYPLVAVYSGYTVSLIAGKISAYLKNGRN